MTSGKEIPELKRYLRNQAKVLDHLFKKNNKYKLLVEFGCFEGGNLRSVTPPHYYVGVDVNEEAIRKANSLYASASSFFTCQSVENFLELSLPKETLLVFPFNLFGNFRQEEMRQYFVTMSKKKVDFVVFSYKADENANRIREAYYKSCFSSIQVKLHQDGTSFCNAETGFSSTVYRHRYYKTLANENSYNLEYGSFQPIGKYFVFTYNHSNRSRL